MAFQVKAGGNWVNVTDPQVKVAGSWTPVQEVLVKDAGTWKSVWVRAEDVRWSTSAVTTSYGTLTESSISQTKDLSFGDTTTMGYLDPASNEYTGSNGYIDYSFASGTSSTAVIKIKNKFISAYTGFMNASISIEYSTNGGTNWTALRSRSATQGSDGSIISTTSSSLSLTNNNRNQLKIRVGAIYSWNYDSFYEVWDYAFCYFEVYDIYVTFS